LRGYFALNIGFNYAVYYTIISKGGEIIFF